MRPWFSNEMKVVTIFYKIFPKRCDIIYSNKTLKIMLRKVYVQCTVIKRDSCNSISSRISSLIHPRTAYIWEMVLGTIQKSLNYSLVNRNSGFPGICIVLFLVQGFMCALFISINIPINEVSYSLFFIFSLSVFYFEM